MPARRRKWFLALPLTLLAIARPAAGDPTATPTNASVTLPLETRRGHIFLQAQLKGAEKPVSMMLDTGFTITTLKPELAETLQLRRTGNTTIVGISGKEDAPVYDSAVFLFGDLSYTPRRLAALPSDRGMRRQDGTFGAGFFRQFVVELDGKTARLYEPGKYLYRGKGEIIPFKLHRQTAVLEAAIPLPGREAVQGQFEIDTGCTGALCLGQDFVQSHQLLEAAGQTAGSDRQGIGGGADIREGHLPQLRIGTLVIERPSTSFFLKGSPADPGRQGHIGWDALRKFKVIFDYSRERLILEKP